MKLKKKVNALPKGTPIPGSIIKIKNRRGNDKYQVRTIVDPRTKKIKFFEAITYEEAVLLLIEKNDALKSGKRLSTSNMNLATYSTLIITIG